ncbi:hypothetical protein ANCDUO_02347 [Ancylostoma duodenale]|uniref:Uncharacterized protein n=1 Tax=Ancylostoma duodenale TaxID=51022 RepID=A0A0C2DBV8_9BILA|nr:hypothetical protein ANCDUO_02347 [Ancylostoma duodenale]
MLGRTRPTTWTFVWPTRRVCDQSAKWIERQGETERPPRSIERTMAAHEGENQGTVQPKGRLPRNQVSELTSEDWGVVRVSEELDRVRDVLGEIQQLQNSRQARSQSAQEEKMDVSQENDQFNSDVIGIVDDRQMRAERPATRLTGAVYGQHSRQHSEPWAKADTEDRGQHLC